MNRTILIVLLVALALAIIIRNETDPSRQEWTNCKESLFSQVVFGECTLIFEGEEEPA
ncbi:MAG: hypothetical protein ACON4G_03635 [Candidatus Puniceispirillaceae bacterium]